MSVIDVPYLPGERGFKTQLEHSLCLILLDRYFKRGDRLIDPFAGSRAVEKAAARLGIEVVSTDIAEGIDCRNLPFEDEEFDGCLTHPPYWKSVEFTRNPGDLSRCKTYDVFLEELGKCFKEISRVLKPNSKFILIIGDCRRKGKYHPLHADAIKIAENIGFKLYEILIFNRKKVRLPFQSPYMLSHDYILAFEKPAHLAESKGSLECKGVI